MNEKIKNNYRFGILLFFLAFLMLPFIVIRSMIDPQIKTSHQPKAQEAPAPGIDTIQQMINNAKDGDTITIPKGVYSGATALPLASKHAFANASRGASDTCFLRIENKNITIKGHGAWLFGEGHDKPYQDPYQTRGGICILDSKVTIDGLRVKEFQKRCVIAVDSTIVYKNGTVDGCDEGGISLLGNSSGLILNNMIVCHNFGGVMLWQNSQAKIINNIFHCSGIMFFYHFRSDDHAYAEIINNIFEGGEGAVNQVDWWKENASKLQDNKLSYNLYSKKDDCNPVFHYCKDYPGKIFGDPLYHEPVVDPRGIANWANFGFKDGSPAVGVGDPSIPGPKNLGPSGGPCADPASSICSSFIASNIPKPYIAPAPTEVPILYPTKPIVDITDVPIDPVVTDSPIYLTPKPTRKIIKQDIFNKKGSLYITNKSSSKIIRIIGILYDNQALKQDVIIEPGKNAEITYANSCTSSQPYILNILYSTSEDNYESYKYKSISTQCSVLTVFGIE